jgi:hypothetical protein
MRLSAAGQLHAGHRSPPQLEDLLLDALNGGANGAKVSYMPRLVDTPAAVTRR